MAFKFIAVICQSSVLATEAKEKGKGKGHGEGIKMKSRSKIRRRGKSNSLSHQKNNNKKSNFEELTSFRLADQVEMGGLVEGTYRVGEPLAELVHDDHLLGGHVDVEVNGAVLAA